VPSDRASHILGAFLLGLVEGMRSLWGKVGAMSQYLDMWGKINASTEDELWKFLEDHPRAEGRDLWFNGAKYFDVDLLEAIRNKLN